MDVHLNKSKYELLTGTSTPPEQQRQASTSSQPIEIQPKGQDEGYYGSSATGANPYRRSLRRQSAVEPPREPGHVQSPVVEMYCVEYNMRHPRRGIALILNHMKFETEDERHGSDKDCERLTAVLTNLGFEVRVKTDLTFGKLLLVLRSLSQENHSLSDCLLVAVLTHGEKSELYAYDHTYESDRLWMYFTADRCPSLAGKPKIIIVQACRGDKFDPGTLLSIKKWRNSDTDDQWVNSKLWAGLLPWNGGSSNGSMICGLPEIAASWWDLLGRGLADSSALHMPRFTTTVDASEEYVIPNCADIIIANSTIEETNKQRFLKGFYAWRSASRGSWFIQTLCDQLELHSENRDMQTILTFVACRVAHHYESDVPKNPLDKMKQIPCVLSMLTRLVYFRQKSLNY